MKARNDFPFKAWVLTPSFKPRAVTIVKKYQAFGGGWDGFCSEHGPLYERSQLYSTPRECVAAGWTKLDALKAKIDEAQSRFGKKKAALQKAASELTKEPS